MAVIDKFDDVDVSVTHRSWKDWDGNKIVYASYYIDDVFVGSDILETGKEPSEFVSFDCRSVNHEGLAALDCYNVPYTKC